MTVSRKKAEIQAMRRDGGHCVICGSDVDVKPQILVPENLDGQYRESNLASLCTRCELPICGPPAGSPRMNLNIDRDLYGRLQERVKPVKGMTVSKLMRLLAFRYVVSSETGLHQVDGQGQRDAG